MTANGSWSSRRVAAGGGAHWLGARRRRAGGAEGLRGSGWRPGRRTSTSRWTGQGRPGLWNSPPCGWSTRGTPLCRAYDALEFPPDPGSVPHLQMRPTMLARSYNRDLSRFTIRMRRHRCAALPAPAGCAGPPVKRPISKDRTHRRTTGRSLKLPGNEYPTRRDNGKCAICSGCGRERRVGSGGERWVSGSSW
jgi:hypothetical protein